MQLALALDGAVQTEDGNVLLAWNFFKTTNLRPEQQAGTGMSVCRCRAHARKGVRTGALLGLDEARGAVDAHDEAARHLGVEGAAVARLFGTQDPAHPRHNLVRRRVRGLVQVDHAIPAVSTMGTG